MSKQRPTDKDYLRSLEKGRVNIQQSQPVSPPAENTPRDEDVCERDVDVAGLAYGSGPRKTGQSAVQLCSTISRTLRLYSRLFSLNMRAASEFAGEFA